MAVSVSDAFLQVLVVRLGVELTRWPRQRLTWTQAALSKACSIAHPTAPVSLAAEL